MTDVCDRPAIVENPELNTACNSERVNSLIYGLINRGDSDWKKEQDIMLQILDDSRKFFLVRI